MKKSTFGEVLRSPSSCVVAVCISACEMAAVNNPYASRAVSTPVLVSGLRQHARVSAGFFPSCAVTTSGEGWCWGCKAFRCSRTPLRVDGGLVFADIAVGVTFSCALITGRARILPGWRISRSAFISSVTLRWRRVSCGCTYRPIRY